MKLVGYNSQMETKIDSLRSTAFLFVGVFARARVSVLAIVVASATAVGLAACGGGGGDGVGNVGNGNGGGGNGRGGVPNLMNPMAYFHGAERVEGLQYQYKDGNSGETDARGGFQFEQGKTVVFSIGNTKLGTMTVRSDAQSEIVTPLRIVGNSENQMARETRAVLVERLLIALDTDDSDSVINIPAAALTSATNLLTIGQLVSMTIATVVMVGDLNLKIPKKADAQEKLERTNNCAYSGVFAGRLSDDGDDAVAVALMPNIGELIVPGVVDLSNASPVVSFISESGTVNGTVLTTVKVGSTVLSINLKTPPLVATFDIEGGGKGAITLASYDRIEFGDGTVFGTVRRVAGDPNADYRLAGVYGNNNGEEGAFVADIYDGSDGSDGGSAEIFYIDDPRVQNLSPARWNGVFPTSGTADLALQVGADSVALTLFADSNIFLGETGDVDIGGSWCEL